MPVVLMVANPRILRNTEKIHITFKKYASNIQKSPTFLQFSFNSIGHLKLFHVPELKF